MVKRFILLSGLCMFLSISAQKTHTVIKGDNPYNISKKYGITIDELLKLNPKVKDGKLAIGDVLNVKGNSAGAKVTTTSASSSQTGKIYLQPKQTIYGITKQYRISETDLRKLNPELDSHTKIGDEITLPLDSIKKYGNSLATTKPAEVSVETTQLANTKTKIDSGNEKSTTVYSSSSQDEYATYTVEQGDTVFSIVNKFGVSIDELIALNPDLARGLKAGMILKIKKLDAAYTKKNGDALSVVLMLPFGYSTNETQYRSMAVDFLTGAKLAIERNASNGQKLDIKVVDSGNEASFKNSLTQINPNNTDLIVGPFFKSNVIDLLDFTKTQKIPVVAPFANSPELYNYSNLIIVETTDQTYSDKIVEEVKTVYSDQKIFIVADSKKENANYIKANLEKTIKNANIMIVNSAADIQLDQNMMTGQSAPVIAILANDNDSVGEAFSSRMIALSKEVQGMKAFSMYSVPSFEKKVDDLSQASLVYLMDRTINTDGSFEKEILAAYKAKYCKTPGKYAIIGFDVMNDMLTRENKKGEIFKQMNKTQTQLATKFEFVKSKTNGAYVNTGLRVIRLTP
ncbi:LysM peptidoglycan-binding domain-containing protein [Chryseobacterium wangxinyae]|uniref:amino acid ABC transporter substrate-binding protein n=1 Tax=Chryseobacterium sp. CY350 TaxID=2997336 RepID=UPI00226DD427|nr:LysM peptidoglycan-binding domain-containing protein [Chryseobacterium sp. CY350]MCY0975802.1 LysM peptidoglycan-binding domain-containing protein [Chryseobacterium sp. CY350]WBZ94588.1 LysM peptidoglycan-binding domain-containing protein [Chryseobacterium sp. CY350]